MRARRHLRALSLRSGQQRGKQTDECRARQDTIRARIPGRRNGRLVHVRDEADDLAGTGACVGLERADERGRIDAARIEVEEHAAWRSRERGLEQRFGGSEEDRVDGGRSCGGANPGREEEIGREREDHSACAGVGPGVRMQGRRSGKSLFHNEIAPTAGAGFVLTRFRTTDNILIDPRPDITGVRPGAAR